MGSSFLTGDMPGDNHIFLGKKDGEFPEWETILWGLVTEVVPDSILSTSVLSPLA